MSKHFIEQRPSKQQGVVLVTGVIFLVILTIIVVSVMRNATLEERMASNARNRQLALQAAEAVLRDAETTLFQSAPFNPFNLASFTAACTNGFCAKPVAGATPRWTSVNWGNTSITRTFATSSSQLAGVNSQPRYIVEYMGSEGGQAQRMCPKILYRISVRGEARDSSVFLTQSTYRHRPAKFSNGSCG